MTQPIPRPRVEGMSIFEIGSSFPLLKKMSLNKKC